MNDSEQLTSQGADRLDRLLENQRRQEFIRLQNQAERTSGAGGLLLAVGIIGLFIGLLMLDGAARELVICAGGAMFGIAIVFLVLAQLIHIRAGLEKLTLK